MQPYGYVANQPYAPPPARRRIWPGLVMLIVAGFMLIIRVIGPHIPLPYNSNGVRGSVTLAQMHGLCSSSLGQFGQLLDPAASRACNYISLGYDGLAVLFWGGLLLGAGGMFLLARRGSAR